MLIAIDIGPTHSCYAWSFRNDPLHVHAKIWRGNTRHFQSNKTLTTVLLGPDKEFLKFGFEAEEKYSELAEDEEEDHTKYYYLRRFKMLLFNTGDMKRHMTIPDEQGRPVEALSVFSMSIKYLKEDLEEVTKRSGADIQESDCQWVLTVPAIWSDGAKQFMREAAEMAGIKKEYLSIVLESEAASLYCMQLPITWVDDGKAVKETCFDKGTKYMVVNIGDTVDFTVYEVVGELTLKELNYASGGAWGETRVDQAFTDTLIKIFGDDVFKKFSLEYTEDYFDLFREFEIKKRSVKMDGSRMENMVVPWKLAEMFKDLKKKEIQQKIDQDPELKGRVIWKRCKLRIDMSIIRSWFNESIDNTVHHVKRMASAGTSVICLVGEFSGLVLLQEEVKRNFPDKQIVIPAEPGFAILNGAVLFGHNPLTIVSRLARCSYGIRVFRHFDAHFHPREKMVTVNSKKKCKDVFGIHIKKGDNVSMGEPQSEHRYTRLESQQTSMIFDIYTSTEREPKFTTDPDCCFIGRLEVYVKGQMGRTRGILVKMALYETVLAVEAKDEKTNEVSKADFNFLKE